MNKINTINFKQPKYILPAILYPLLLATGYFVIDMFHTEKADIGDPSMQTTEYLNPNLPQPKVKDDLGGKYENMLKSFGKIDDFTAVDNIERDGDGAQKEEYESKYSDDDLQAMEATAPGSPDERDRQMEEQLRRSAERAAALQCRACRRPAAAERGLPFPAYRERAAHPEPAARAGPPGGTGGCPGAAARAERRPGHGLPFHGNRAGTVPGSKRSFGG